MTYPDVSDRLAPSGPSPRKTRARLALLCAMLAVVPAVARAQLRAGITDSLLGALAGQLAAPHDSLPPAPATRFTHGSPSSPADSMAWVAARSVADQAAGYHIVVSIFDRELWVIDGGDTLLSAPVAVGKGTTLQNGQESWTFDTPRGRREVLRKEANAPWVPPEWHYVEVAQQRGLRLSRLTPSRPVPLSDGRLLEMRGGLAGVVGADGLFEALPVEEEIVFDSTLYIPPLGSRNREVEGELGRYQLDLGDGYLLHGTPHLESIGDAATHGCVRLGDADVAWLYSHVPVGTPVYIY